MKYKAKKSFLIERDVISTGAEFETTESRGRDLVKKGFAEAVDNSEKPAKKSEAPAEEKTTRRKKSDNE